ncbi:MAG: tetratricopeptide repeat protein [Candidatus Omnitrophica bacterium]|nr:tetratricopeptide repeat protein [Candidatus Omnitrophota bacterium]
MDRQKTILAAILVCIFLAYSAAAFTQAEEASVTGAEKRVSPPAKFNSIISQIDGLREDAALRKLIADSFSDCCAFENYDKFVAEGNAALQKPEFNNKDYLNYAIAKARLDQLSCLSKSNEIEAGRLYMSVNDKYFAEAIEHLDKVPAMTQSKSLVIDNNVLKFIVFREKLQPQKADAMLDAVALQISKYNDDRKICREELARVSEDLNDMGLDKQAIKIRLLYASKVDPKEAQEVVDEIMKSADHHFLQNSMKEASALYEQYIAAAPAYYNKEEMAAKVMEIGEKYYDAGKFKDARKYYESYIEKYGDLPPSDYGSYKLAMTYYNMKDHVRSISQLEGFLEKYKNSVWFDKAFEMLAKVYYENLPRDKAIENLRGLMSKYYRQGAGDYVRVLIAMLYYTAKNYETAEDELKKIEPNSMYAHTSKMIRDDIKNIKDNDAAPTFGSDSTETYKVWDVYQPTDVKVTVTIGSELAPMTTADDGTITIEAPKGAKLQMALQGIVDEDRFNEYQLDKEDPSRLPKMLREETEKDLLFLHWASEDGKFTDDNESETKTWQAPNEPGVYKMSVKVDDFGLVRVPNKGVRKDIQKDVNITIIVK